MNKIDNKYEKVFIICIYLDDNFIGYIKNYRFHRNKKYRFDRTKNVIKASKFGSKSGCEGACNKLNNLKDELIYNQKYSFKCTELTNQELRRSKLNVLNIVKIRKGIFKNKIVE